MLRRDDGQAVVATVAISFVLAVLITTILAMAVHTNDATVADRSRIQGAQSAESALSVMLDALTRSLCVPDVGLSGPVTMGGTGQYQAMVRLPAEAGVRTPSVWDPNLTASAGCTTAPPASQERTVTAWGYGPRADSLRPSLRKLEASLQVVPLSGYRFACFAGGAAAPNGLAAFNADTALSGSCYSRQLTATNLVASGGTLITRGGVDLRSNTLHDASVWAGGDIGLLAHATVTGSLTSSAGEVRLRPNAKVLGNVTAATRIVREDGSTILGTACPAGAADPGCPTAAPPVLAMPVLRCAVADHACWTQRLPGIVSMSASDMTLWLTSHTADLRGTFHVADPGTVQMLAGGTVTGPLTIITTGKVVLGGSLTTADVLTAPSACTPPAGPRTCEVAIVAGSTAGDAISVNGPRFTSNQATLSVLLHAAGTVRFSSSASQVSMAGAVYGLNVEVGSRGTVLRHSQDLGDHPPDVVDWRSSAAVRRYAVLHRGWREVVPSPPA